MLLIFQRAQLHTLLYSPRLQTCTVEPGSSLQRLLSWSWSLLRRLARGQDWAQHSSALVVAHLVWVVRIVLTGACTWRPFHCTVLLVAACLTAGMLLSVWRRGRRHRLQCWRSYSSRSPWRCNLGRTLIGGNFMPLFLNGNLKQDTNYHQLRPNSTLNRF